MSLITHIDRVPLYSTIEEAVLWGRQYNLTGYHVHNILGQVGYMGGNNHQQIVQAMKRGVVNVLQPQQIRTVTTQSLPTSNSGGSGY
jgi:hypothetical protein